MKPTSNSTLAKAGSIDSRMRSLALSLAPTFCSALSAGSGKSAGWYAQARNVVVNVLLDEEDLPSEGHRRRTSWRPWLLSIPRWRYDQGSLSFGPWHDLPKKVRALGLKHALSAKASRAELTIIEDAMLEAQDQRSLAAAVEEAGWNRALVIDGAEVNAGFARAAQNIDGVDVLPSQGANVYDILRRDQLVLTKAGVAALEERLK